MEIKKYYEKLYKFQDEILKEVFENTREFYLTGGTCLHRFYFNARYSDDLDFFANSSKFFYYEIRILEKKLDEKFELIKEVEAKDFVRWKIKDLKIDFVNDITAYCGNVEVKNNIVIDNLENICANKFLAVLGRDEAKDVFDLFIIDKYFDLDYKQVINCANEKAIIYIEDLIYRLKTFPKSWLDKLNFVDEKYKNEFDLTPLIEKLKVI